MFGDLVEPNLMASAVVLLLHKDIDQGQRVSHGQHTPPERQYIGVIVAPGHLRHVGIGAQGAPDTWILVGDHGDAEAGSANNKAPLTAAVHNLFRRS